MKNTGKLLLTLAVAIVATALLTSGGSAEGATTEEGSEVSVRDVELSILTRIPDFNPRDPYDLEESNSVTYIDYVDFDAISRLGNSYSDDMVKWKQALLEDLIEKRVGIPYDFSEELKQLTLAYQPNIFGSIQLSFFIGEFDKETIKSQLQENGYEEKTFAGQSMWTKKDHATVSFYDEGLVVGSWGMTRDFLMAEADEAGTLFEKYPRYRKIVSHFESQDLQADAAVHTMKPPTGSKIVPRRNSFSDIYYRYMDHPSEAGRAARQYEEDRADDKDFEYSGLEFDSEGSLLIAEFTGVQLETVNN